jgi:hypothetical protein
MGRQLSSYRDAILILQNAQNNVGIGTSTGQKFQEAISDLEKATGDESAIECLAKTMSALGESLAITQTQVAGEVEARKGSNVVAICAIAATLLTAILTALPSYLPYFGHDPNASFQSDLVGGITELKKAIANFPAPVVDCRQQSVNTNPIARPVTR